MRCITRHPVPNDMESKICDCVEYYVLKEAIIDVLTIENYEING